MNRPGRLSLFRRMAFALVAAQALAFALAPVIESGSVQSSEVRLERSHTHCAVIHQSDTCFACQLLAVRSRAPLVSESALPSGGRIVAQPSPRTTHHAPRPPFTAGLHSRAPPISA